MYYICDFAGLHANSDVRNDLPEPALKQSVLRVSFVAVATTVLAACAALPESSAPGAGSRPYSYNADAERAWHPSLAREMRAIAPHVYVDAGVQRDAEPRLLNLVAKARVRASFFYGDLVSNPDIFFCSSIECYRQFGGIGLGYTVGNTIAISPLGGRAAILSHEISHVELATRLGVQQNLDDMIPQWFDEGMAVMVSLAHEFSDEAWLDATHDGELQPSLTDLSDRRGWSRMTGPDGCNMQFSYGTARQEVVRWYDRVGRKGLDQLLSALREGRAFQSAYRNIEAANAPLQARQEIATDANQEITTDANSGTSSAAVSPNSEAKS